MRLHGLLLVLALAPLLVLHLGLELLVLLVRVGGLVDGPAVRRRACLENPALHLLLSRVLESGLELLLLLGNLLLVLVIVSKVKSLVGGLLDISVGLGGRLLLVIAAKLVEGFLVIV